MLNVSWQDSTVTLDDRSGEAKAHMGADTKRMLLIASDAFIKMMETLDVFGSAGSTIIYMMGQGKGRYDVLNEIERLRLRGSSFTKRQALDNVLTQNRMTGWGASRILNYDKKRETLTILLENNPLAATLNTKDIAGVVCNFHRGYWIGVVSEILEKQVNCTETRCISKGDSYCEFQISPSQLE